MVRIDQNDLLMSGYCSLFVTENLAGNGIHSLATINLLELEVAFSIASAFKGSNSSNKMSLCCTKKVWVPLLRTFWYWYQVWKVDFLLQAAVAAGAETKSCAKL